MIAQELEEIKAEHRGTGYQPNRCVACGKVVPCRALRLVARIEELESENAAYREVWRILRDQSVIVAEDGSVFGKIAEWLRAPSNTASADLEARAALGVGE
jgi:hypothetical protein